MPSSPSSPASSHLSRLVEASSALAALPSVAQPPDVFAALYQQVAGFVCVQDFVVSLYDRDTQMIRCGYVVVDGGLWPADDLQPLKLGSGPTSRVIRTGRPVVIADILTELTGWVRREVGTGPPVRSMLLAPMTRAGEVVGVVQAQSPHINAFSADDAAALSVLANQAAAALEAIRHRNQAEQAAARAGLLDDVSRLLGASLDMTEVLTALAERVTGVMGAGCAIYLLAASGDRYEDRMVRYRDPRLAPLATDLGDGPRLTPAESVVGRLILRGEPRFFADVARAPLEPRLAETVAEMDVRQAMFAPLRRHGQVLGTLMVLGTSMYPLREDDFPLAIAVADRAAGAIENAALHGQVSDQRRFLAHLIETAPIGIAVVRGPDHIYEIANEVYRRFKGGVQVIGRPYDDVIDVPGESWTITGRERLNAARSMRESIHIDDTRATGPDGAPRYISVDLSPLPADRSGPSGVLILVWDTTDRVLAAERLGQLAHQAAAHAAELEAMIAGMAEGVMVTAADGALRLLNPAGRRLFGDAWLNPATPVWDAVPTLCIRNTDGQPVTDAEARALWTTTQPRMGVEFIMPLPDGSDRVISASVAPLPANGSDQPSAGAVAIFEDITDRRALEEAREEFLAQASHELRTPLTALLGYLQTAERRLTRDPAASVKEPVTGAVAQAFRLRELVTDLLDASRIRQGRLELQPATVNLVRLITTVVEERRLAGHDPDVNHTLHLDGPQRPITGMWDEGRLRQVFVNLLDNAVKYSPAGGNIWVSVREEDQTAVVVVRDEGIGIPDDERGKLFRPFGRAEHRAARHIPGFGMGLFICKDIVERHGGRIDVASRPGAGTTFTVTLPR